MAKKSSDFTDFEIEFGMLLLQLKKIAHSNGDKLTKFFCYVCSEILLSHHRKQLSFNRDDEKNLAAHLIGEKRTIQWQSIMNAMSFLFNNKEEYGYSNWNQWEKVVFELLQLLTERIANNQKLSSSLIFRLFEKIQPAIEE